MNRQDLALVLNQVDNVGDTLMRNRMNAEAKQERTADRDLRERMFTEQQATRKELQTQNNAWKTQNEDQQTLQMIIRANADGSLDDAAIAKANEWIMQHPQLGRTGIQLTKPAPKQVGTMETSQTRNLGQLKQLQEQIRMATTPEAKAQAEQDLADFKSLLPTRAGATPESDMETVTEVFPEQKATKKPEVTTIPGEKRTGLFGIDALAKDAPPIKTTNVVETPYVPERRVSYKQPRGTASQPAPAAKSAGKLLDAATAKQLLQEAGGDKNKARELAKQRGYTF